MSNRGKNLLARIPAIARRPLPDAWPEAARLDRLAWERAVRNEGYRNRGPGADWRPETRDLYAGAYGSYLVFLASRGELEADVGPAARITLERVIAHFEAKAGRIKAHSMQQQHRALANAVIAMEPEQDFQWLKRLPTRPTQAEVDASKRPRPTIDLIAVLDQAIRLLQRWDRADSKGRPRPHSRGRDYRDALIIALLCWEPLRRQNIAGLTLGDHVLVDDDGIQILIKSKEMKTDRARFVVMPAFIERHFRHYLNVWRPLLLGGAVSNALWATHHGGAVTYNSMYGSIRRAAFRLLKMRISPHDFRYGAATTILSDDPGAQELAVSVLGHKNRSTLSVYNKSGTAPALRQYQSLIAAHTPARRRAPGDFNDEDLE